MRNVEMMRIIDKSIERTKVILFRPIEIKKWIILLFISVMAGSSFSFNGGGDWPSFNDRTCPIKKPKAVAVTSTSKEEGHVNAIWDSEDAEKRD